MPRLRSCLALSHIAELIADRRDAQTRELRLAEAVAKHTRAVLVYPYDYAQSAPLLCDAAELAGDRPWYWIDCGRARETLGDLDAAMTAYDRPVTLPKQGIKPVNAPPRRLASPICTINRGAMRRPKNSTARP